MRASGTTYRIHPDHGRSDVPRDSDAHDGVNRVGDTSGRVRLNYDWEVTRIPWTLHTEVQHRVAAEVVNEVLARVRE